jgi:CubicO group peptidase (beta-lactamase class C family)
MPRSLAVSTLVLFLLAPDGAAARQGGLTGAEHRAVEERVDSVFADLVGPTSPGCALSVMRDGAPVYERGYGMANLEYGIPITPQSVFHVASVSKHFTAMAVELLVNEGRVSWDDDIRKHVPEVPDFGTPITLRHLVHHVSGIRDQWNLLAMAGWRWEADVVTQKDVLEITSMQTALNFEPGERYMYSNTGFTLLAVVVERVTGQTLREFTTERIFEPLGMGATHFHDDHEMIVRNRAWAYAPDPDGLFGLKNSIPDFDVVGATSLFTTAHDMAAWDRNFTTGQVGGDAALDRLRQRFVLNSGDTIGYAHGLSLGTYRGLRTEGHGGADAGYRSDFLRFPDQSLSVAVLCNYPSANPGRRSRQVAEAYLGELMEEETEETSADPAAETVPMTRAELEPLAGVYRGELPTQMLRVHLDGDTLRVDVGQPFVLRPIGGHRFEVVGPGVVVTFEPGSTPGAVSLDAPGQGRFQRADAWEPTESELAAFTGTYRSAELGTDYRLALEDGVLWFHHRKLDSRRLSPTFPDGFQIRGSSAAFTRDAAGRIDGFALSDGRVWNVRFDRVGG